MNENAIDLVVSKKAQEGLDQLYKKLTLTYEEIGKINSQQIDFNRGRSPRNLAEYNNTLADFQRQQREIQNLQRELQRLTQQINTLNQSRRAGARATAEESVNQSILNTNARNAALANSQLAGAYRNLNAQRTIAAQKVQDLIARGRTATQTQRQYNREIQNAQRDFDRLNQRVLAADRAIGRFNRNVGNYPKQAIMGIKNLLGAFGIVGGVALIASITKGVYEQVKAQESLDLALKQVTGTQAEYLRAQIFIKEQAELNGVEINSLTNAYTKFYVAASDKISVKNIENIFASITKAGSALGLSVETQERAFLALNQMFSKGTVQAEELRGQLGDALPGAIGIMTRAYQKLHPELKITEASFAKLMKDGKILASEVMPEFARELERTYNLETVGRIENLSTAQNRMTNSFKNFIKELNDGDGAVSKFFGQITRGAAKNLDYLTDAIKSNREARKEELEFQKTASYTTELNELEALGEKRKSQAIIRKAQIEEEYKATREQFDKLKLVQKELLDSGKKNTEENEKNEKQLQYLNNLLAGNAGQLDAVRKILKDKNKEQSVDNELTKEQIKVQKEKARLLEDELKNLHELRILRIESQERILTDLVDNENDYVKSRLQNNEALNRTLIEKAEEYLNESLRKAKGNQTLQLIAYEKYYKDYESIVKINEENILKIKKDAIDEYMEYVSKYQDEGLKLNLDDLGLTKEGFEEFSDGLKKTANELKDLKKLTDDWIKSFTEGFFKNAGLPTVFKVLNKEIEGFGENWETTFLAVSEIAQEAFNFINQASQANFDAEYERLEKRKEISLLFAGESAAAREEIERQYDDKRREIEQREAKARKQLALFNIAVDTAQAIVGFLANPGGTKGVTLSIAAGVIGTIQAGLVASQEIPQFWKGTDNAPQGWAFVDEKGPEVHTDKSGNVKSLGSEKGANLRYLERGDKVYKTRGDYFAKQGLLLQKSIGASMFSGVEHVTKDKGLSADEIDGIMGKYFSKIQVNHTTIDKDGLRLYMTNAAGKTERANNRGSATGYIV